MGAAGLRPPRLPMTSVGQVSSLWRYPVKSMAGQRCPELFFGFAGVFGDRCWAIHDSAARPGLPYLTARILQSLLCHTPGFRFPERAAFPPNLAQATSLLPGAAPANASAEDLAIDVVTPAGEHFALEDPGFLRGLARGLDPTHQLRLLHSDRALADCRPASLISSATIAGLEAGLAMPLDSRRFRANIYAAWTAPQTEDAFLGRRIQIGERVVLYFLERDPRCKMISLDPATGAHDPAVLRYVAQQCGSYTGIYAAVLIEGIVREGDPITLLA
jgi:MOSC domain-containing protein